MPNGLTKREEICDMPTDLALQQLSEDGLIIIPDAEYDRRKFLGGSNAAAVMGVGATYDDIPQTPLTVYFAKVEGQEEMSAKQRLFLERRKRWEGPIIEMLREEFDADVIAFNRRFRDSEYDFMAAEVDFEWRDRDTKLIENGEIKTVSPFAFGERDGWGEPGTADIPVHYSAQEMHGLGVTKRRICITAAMVGLDTMLFYRTERDEETITAMREHMSSFWLNNVLKRIPPEPVSYEDCLKLTLRMRGKPVEINDAIATRLEQLRQIRATNKSNEGAESEIKFDILNYIRKAWLLEPTVEIADNAVLLRDGQKIATYNAQSSTRIDSERLRNEKPEIARAYSKTNSTRVLRLTKPK